MRPINESVQHVLKEIGIIEESSGRVGGPTTYLSRASMGKRGLSGYINDPQTVRTRPTNRVINQQRLEEIEREEQEREEQEREASQAQSAPPRMHPRKQEAMEILSTIGDTASTVILNDGSRIKPSEVNADNFSDVVSIEYKQNPTGAYTSNFKINTGPDDAWLRIFRVRAWKVGKVDEKMKRVFGEDAEYAQVQAGSRKPSRT